MDKFLTNKPKKRPGSDLLGNGDSLAAAESTPPPPAKMNRTLLAPAPPRSSSTPRSAASDTVAAAAQKAVYDPDRVGSGVAAKKKKKAVAAKGESKPRGTAGKIAGKTLEQHRRAMGDVVKGRITVEKWCIAARTHCTLSQIEPEVFERLIVANATTVVPAWDDDVDIKTTPVFVASVKGSDAMANIFGATKVRGGTRMGSWTADKGELVYLPASKELRVWWTMK